MFKYIFLIAGILNIFTVLNLLMNNKMPHYATVTVWGVFFVLSMIAEFYRRALHEKLSKNIREVLLNDGLTKDEKEVKIIEIYESHLTTDKENKDE